MKKKKTAAAALRARTTSRGTTFSARGNARPRRLCSSAEFATELSAVTAEAGTHGRIPLGSLMLGTADKAERWVPCERAPEQPAAASDEARSHVKRGAHPPPESFGRVAAEPIQCRPRNVQIMLAREPHARHASVADNKPMSTSLNW
eukprot:Amastigsp_a841423_20.p1 type:complete len:147 gc:universal Amastigsp_a841423_20:462-22(-)